MFMASVGTKLGYLLCKKGMDDFREVFNQDKIGGGAVPRYRKAGHPRRTARPTRSRGDERGPSGDCVHQIPA